MRTWAWMLGGLIVWSVHFIGVYMISSVADVVATADAPGWRMAALAFSGLCALITGGILVVVFRRKRLGFPDQMAALGATIGLIAICWQALPTLIGF
ncbi:MAG: hypothetical protein EON86_14435 [Brevundimonas sp.]|nr:MAG: hypothetical protein EON86_14435 [Brevundimonas sp.]